MASIAVQVRKCLYYSRNLALTAVPRAWYRKRLMTILERTEVDADIQERVKYCNQLAEPFALPASSVPVDSPSILRESAAYVFDLRRILRYFPPDLSLAYQFGDVKTVPDAPTIVKSRPIGSDNANSIMLRLNEVRHFHFVRRDVPYEAKCDTAVWRGRCTNPMRRLLAELYATDPAYDIGDSGERTVGKPIHKPFLTVPEQLRYRFVISVEGNDVATNLKWILSSNSLCFMPRPRFETWFMEGRLIAGRHYVELRDDFADLPEKIAHYREHPEDAHVILDQAHAHVARFSDPVREELVGLLVMRKYFRLSGQMP